MRSIPLLISLLLAIGSGCQMDATDDASSRGVTGGKADLVGSCEGACGGQSLDGSCFCDDQCADYGDCCDDVVDECELAQCDPVADTGCGDGETCAMPVCPAFCPDSDPNCCDPAQCIPADPAPSCESLGGSCESSPFDVTFPADCEDELGMQTADGTCPAFNQACCVPAPSCPIAPPPSCSADEEPEPIVDDLGCIVGFECVAPAPPCPIPPPPSFCSQDEEPEPIVDDLGCVVGFECVEV